MDIKIINPTKKHLQTVIILHGMNQDINDILYISERETESQDNQRG